MHTTTRTPSSNQPRLRLLVLIGVVLLGHWVALRAVPGVLAAQAATTRTDGDVSGSFTMRTLAAEPMANAVAQPAPHTSQRRSQSQPAPHPAPTTQQDNAAQPAPDDTSSTPPADRTNTSNSPLAPVESSYVASKTIADDGESGVRYAPVVLAAATPVATATPAFASASPTAGTVAPTSNKSPEPPAEGAPSANSTAGPATPAASASAPAVKPSSASKAVRDYLFPPPARLKYDVKGEIKGFPYMVNGDLQWKPEEKTYTARLEVSHFLLGSRVQTSTGQIGAQGLEPTRFGDKVRSEVAAHFERHKNKVTFSANTPDAPLQTGAQDQLSVFIQLAGMFAADAKGFAKGSSLTFQAVGPRSSETWVFNVGTLEKLSLPAGEFSGVRLWRDPSGEYDTKLEIWLSPELGYLPARMRLTQPNGDFVDQQLRSVGK